MTPSSGRTAPPHALFEWLRSECPVHWTPPITECPGEDGFWSVTRADDVHAASRDSLLILWAVVKWFGGFALRLAGFVGLPVRNVASSDK